MMYKTNTGQVLKPDDDPVPVFKGFKTLIWIHWKLIYESKKFPFPYYVYHLFSFTPNYKTKGVPGQPGYRTDVHSSQQNLSGTSVTSWPHAVWTFNS